MGEHDCPGGAVSERDAVSAAQADMERVVDALAWAFARRRNCGQIYIGGESDPTPGDRTTAIQLIGDMLDAGWLPPSQARKTQ